jgi:hypothetical protein
MSSSQPSRWASRCGAGRYVADHFWIPYVREVHDGWKGWPTAMGRRCREPHETTSSNLWIHDRSEAKWVELAMSTGYRVRPNALSFRRQRAQWASMAIDRRWPNVSLAQSPVSVADLEDAAHVAYSWICSQPDLLAEIQNSRATPTAPAPARTAARRGCRRWPGPSGPLKGWRLRGHIPLCTAARRTSCLGRQWRSWTVRVTPSARHWANSRSDPPVGYQELVALGGSRTFAVQRSTVAAAWVAVGSFRGPGVGLVLRCYARPVALRLSRRIHHFAVTYLEISYLHRLRQIGSGFCSGEILVQPRWEVARHDAPIGPP